MQRAFDGFRIRFGDRLGLVRFFGDQNTLGRVHHGADGFGLCQRFGTAIMQVFGLGRFLFSTGFGLGGFGGHSGNTGFVSKAGRILGRSLHRGHGRHCRGFLSLRQRFHSGSFFGTDHRRPHRQHGGAIDGSASGAIRSRGWRRYGNNGRRHGLLGLAGCFGSNLLGGFRQTELLCVFCGDAFALVLCFAQAALLRQLFLLATDQFGLAAGFFLAPNQFRVVLHRHRLLIISTVMQIPTINRVFTLDEGALLADFDLNGPGTALAIGLFDFTGRFFHQRDLLALSRSSAMASLQKGQQFLLVRLTQNIAGRGLGDP